MLDRYASLFNARDWDGVRALVSDDCRLDLVSKSQRRGKSVGFYFSNYEKQDLFVRPAKLEGRWVLAVFAPGVETPAYFIMLEWDAGKVTSIRDFRYARYVAAEAEFEVE